MPMMELVPLATRPHGEDVVQSSLSKSGETSRVAAVLELEAPPP